MKITIIQQDIVWADVKENIRKADAALDSQPGADLYIFPEMFSTGFCTFPEGIAETEGQTLQWMKTKSAQIGAAIAGSVAIRNDGLVQSKIQLHKQVRDIYDWRKLWYIHRSLSCHCVVGIYPEGFCPAASFVHISDSDNCSLHSVAASLRNPAQNSVPPLVYIWREKVSISEYIS